VLEILEAALTIFAERGFEAATNKEIAERAGVNQGLIYFYFASKADVFFAAFAQHANLVKEQLNTIFEQIQEEDPTTGLVSLFRQIVLILDTPRTVSLLRIMHQVMGGRAPEGELSREEEAKSVALLARHLAGLLRDYLTLQIDRNQLRAVNTGITAYLITNTLISSVGRGVAGRTGLTCDEFVEAVSELYGHGLLLKDSAPINPMN
jgi:AcrR family transcriptional regulator